MNFIYFGFLVYASIYAVPVKLDEVLWSKLDNYQNKTGISDEVKISIWQKSVNIRAGVRQGKF